MGYRSDVLYVADFVDDNCAQAALTAAKLKYELDEWEWENINQTNQYIIFCAYGWKWYDSYDGVKTIIDMFENFFHKMYNSSVKHVCIGEETDDNTEELLESETRDVPDTYWDIYIHRQITTPWD